MLNKSSRLSSIDRVQDREGYKEIANWSGLGFEIPSIKISGGIAALFIVMRLWQVVSTNDIFQILAASFLILGVIQIYSGAYALWRRVALTSGKELITPLVLISISTYFFIQEF